MGGFWETKNLDFRTFFNVYSKSFFEDASRGRLEAILEAKSAILEAKRAGGKIVC